jgi:hypothetical protein
MTTNLIAVAARVLAGALLVCVTGCASYATPGGPADLSRITDAGVREGFAAQPEASFPVHIAVARVQAPGYRSYAATGYGNGAYSVVTVRDFEQEGDFQRLRALPDVAGVATLNRLLISTNLRDSLDLRQAAAKLRADMLLVYTVDTEFYKGEQAAPIALLTLGLSPTTKVRVTSTVAMVLMDVRSGFVYGTVENTKQASAWASGWTTEAAVDASRQKTERDAFETALGEFEKLWPSIVASHEAPKS